MKFSHRRERFAAALGLAITCAHTASAQRDEFDFVGPNEPSRRDANLAADAPVPEPFAAAVVRVLAAGRPNLATSPCGHGRLATGTVRSGVGIRIGDGSTILVPTSVVSDAVAIVVHGEDVGTLVPARRIGGDAELGIAVLRVVTSASTMRPSGPHVDADGSTSAGPPSEGQTVTWLSRDPNGGLRSGYLAAGAPSDDRFSLPGLADAAGEGMVAFHAGRFVGLAGSATGPNGAATRFVGVSRLRTLVEASHDRASVGARIDDAVGSALTAYVGLSRTTWVASRCDAARRLVPVDLSHDAAAETDLTSDERLALAVAAWNAYGLDPHRAGEASAQASVVARLDALRDAPASDAAAVLLGAVDEARRIREARAVEDAAARVRTRAAERAALEADYERSNRPITYTLGVTVEGARNGSTGFDGAGLSLGMFGTVPRMASFGGARIGAALGGSVVLGGGGGAFLGLFTADLGVSVRFGGRVGGFAMAAYSPGLLSGALASHPTFVYSSFRAAVGFALGRQVVFAGYRGAAPEGDYPLHLIEAGVAVHYGPASRPSGLDDGAPSESPTTDDAAAFDAVDEEPEGVSIAHRMIASGTAHREHVRGAR